MLGPTQRMLRCARCGTEWPVAAALAKSQPNLASQSEPEPGGESAPAPGAEQRPEPSVAPAPPRGAPALAVQAAAGRAEPALRPLPPRAEWAAPPPGSQPLRRTAAPAGIGAWFGWLGSIALIALLVWGAYAYRGQLMHVWPPSQRLYDLLGLGPTAATPPR
jgi:hypothetical protein